MLSFHSFIITLHSFPGRLKDFDGLKDLYPLTNQTSVRRIDSEHSFAYLRVSLQCHSERSEVVHPPVILKRSEALHLLSFWTKRSVHHSSVFPSGAQRREESEIPEYTG